jgi:phosphoglycolate phosphatase-like HAD superfamily hydrolase
MQKLKKLIVYDLDGTLVDTRQDIIDGVNAMLVKMGKEKLPDKEIESYVGSGLRSLMSRALKEEDDKKSSKSREIFHEVLREKYAGKLNSLSGCFRNAEIF